MIKNGSEVSKNERFLGSDWIVSILNSSPVLSFCNSSNQSGNPIPDDYSFYFDILGLTRQQEFW